MDKIGIWDKFFRANAVQSKQFSEYFDSSLWLI